MTLLPRLPAPVASVPIRSPWTTLPASAVSRDAPPMARLAIPTPISLPETRSARRGRGPADHVAGADDADAQAVRLRDQFQTGRCR